MAAENTQKWLIGGVIVLAVALAVVCVIALRRREEQGALVGRPVLGNVKRAQEPPRPTTTYNNLEEITFPDGFDPNTFMPKKIVVKRNAETT